jgi:hypothetical protein
VHINWETLNTGTSHVAEVGIEKLDAIRIRGIYIASPSTAKAWTVAYFAWISLSFFCASELYHDISASMLSHCAITTRGGGLPDIGVTFPPRANPVPPIDQKVRSGVGGAKLRLPFRELSRHSIGKHPIRRIEMRAVLLTATIGMAALALSGNPSHAAQGCGPGWYYNGFRCVPAHGPGYRGYDDGPRYYREAPRYRGGDYADRAHPYGHGHDYGDPRCGRPNYTIQDGVCKPYTGR